MLRQFGAHVAVAIENARLFEHEREYTSTLETLAEIGREFGAILNLDELLTRIATLTRRVIDYRTFGILLLNDETRRARDEGRRAVRRQGHRAARASSATVSSATRRCTRRPVLVPDVSRRSALHQAGRRRALGARHPADAEGSLHRRVRPREPRARRLHQEHVEILTLLASQAAVAIENARLYETIRANEVRLEKEIRFAQRVQAALLPTELPKRLKGVDVAARSRRRASSAATSTTSWRPSRTASCVAVGDVSGKGVPAALYSAFAGELVRSRTFRRRYAPERFSPAGVLASMNTILHERQLEEYYCTLCYAVFDFKRRTVLMANSGLPYPIRCSGNVVSQIELPGVPLGSFAGSSYDELSFELAPGDVYVFFSDGVSEANDALGREFGYARLLAVVDRTRHRPAREIVDAIFAAVQEFRGDTPPNDDMTAVALKITA